MSYILSLIVPTKDRYEYLKHLIYLIDGFGIEEIELVIQDNTFNNAEILKFQSLKQRSYLKYYHKSEQIPISLNGDLAILNSTGEYICFIGDDDGILPNIIDCVKWMKKNGIEALRSANTIYNWPDFQNSGKKSISGAVISEKFSYNVEKIDISKSLDELANHGFAHIFTLPKSYQGIVKRTCLDEIYKIGGTYFPGPSPDMAGAVALSFIVKKFVIINLPVILTGQSQHVGGGERKLKGVVKNIDDVHFLPKDAKINWNNRIPRVWCSQTVWPESAIKAIQYMNKESEVKIDYEYILAIFIVAHNSQAKLAFSLSNNKTKLFYYLFYFKIWSIYNAIRYKIKYLLTEKKQIDGVDHITRNICNIEEACDFVMKKYSKYTSIEAFNKLNI